MRIGRIAVIAAFALILGGGLFWLTREPKIETPKFLRRDGPASLSEMLQQPPTTVYGSSINVYAYRDDSGAIREVSIAGHADSNTCEQVSGLTAGALLTKRPLEGEFFLAGSGRLIAPAENETGIDDTDPVIYEFLQLKVDRQSLEDASDEQAKTPSGMTREELDKKLAESEENPKVLAFERAQSADILANLMREAKRIADASGLVQIHLLNTKVLEAARDRVSKAIVAQTRTLVRFDDLLEAAAGGKPDEEAVVYLPVYRTTDSRPLTIDLPVGEFSRDGFAEALKEHRSAVETAIVGNAHSRREFAEKLITNNKEEVEHCTRASPAELERSVDLESCTPDGCYGSGKHKTLRTYCKENVDLNGRIAARWRADALTILQKIEADRASEGGKFIDASTYASLINSMLRDWELPVGHMQSAFEYWRTQRRADVWRAILHEADRQHIDRNVFSGENIIFPSRIDGDRLVIAPTMVLDLRRSAVLVDKGAGATAVLDKWSERRGEPQQVAADAKQPSGLALLQGSSDTITTELKSKPMSTVEGVESGWLAELPASKVDFDRRLERGAKLNAMELNDEIAREIDGAAETPAAWVDGDTLNLLLTYKSNPSLTSETLLRGTLKFAGVLAGINREPDRPSSAWDILASVNEDGSLASTPGGRWVKSNLQVDAESLLKRLLKLPPGSKADYIAAAVRGRALPDEPSALEAEYQKLRIEPQSAPNIEVAGTRQIEVALLQRADVEKALIAVAANGTDALKAVSNSLDHASAIDPSDAGSDQLSDVAGDAKQAAASNNTLGPIAREEWLDRLQKLDNRLLDQAARVEKRIGGLRYSRLHEALGARLAFDKGNYAESLHRYFAPTTPLSLYDPHMAVEWSADIRGRPGAVKARMENGVLIVSSQKDEASVDVLKIGGVPSEEWSALSTAIEAASDEGWSDGERIADQLLMTQFPVRSPLVDAIKALGHDDLWLAFLKASVYGCVAPAAQLVPPSGRCIAKSDAEARHDRVKEQAEIFEPASLDDLQKIADTRFPKGG